MMVRKLLVGCVVATLWSNSAVAAPFLFDWGINIDDTIHNSAVAGIDLSGFDDFTGVGSVAITLTGAGNHHVGMFVDHDIDAGINTFFNESGQVIDPGSIAAGQSWEIDEPGFGTEISGGGSGNPGTVFPEYIGDIYDNFSIFGLDNDVWYDWVDDQYLDSLTDDVSMALAWDFALAAGEIADIVFNIEFLDVDNLDVGSLPGFGLLHSDADSGEHLFFTSSLAIRTVGVPEPGTLGLLLGGLALLTWRRRQAH